MKSFQLGVGSGSTGVVTCSLSATKDCMPSQRVAVDLGFIEVECCT